MSRCVSESCIPNGRPFTFSIQTKRSMREFPSAGGGDVAADNVVPLVESILGVLHEASNLFMSLVLDLGTVRHESVCVCVTYQDIPSFSPYHNLVCPTLVTDDDPHFFFVEIE
jgi:hypothetical protein